MVGNREKGLWVGDFIQTQKDNETNLYQGIKRNIDANGFFDINIGQNPPVKIYTIELTLILCSDEVNAINTFIYLEYYEDAYNKGIKFFKENYFPNVNTLYGINAELYVKDIHNNYFHTDHGKGIIGWNHVKNNYPLTLSPEIISEFGYYAGIVSQVDKMVDSYFELFQKFDKGCDCEQTNQFQQTKNKQANETIKAPVLALFCSLIDEIRIDKKEETESAPKYCKRICEKYGFTYTDRVRQNYYGSKTKTIRKEFIDKVLPLLDAGIKDVIQKHLDNK